MLVKKDPELIAPYLQDYSNLKGGFCEAVFFPETEEEVIGFLKSASETKTSVTISAAGTGVAGGRIPFGGFVLSLEKMNKIEEVKRLPSGQGVATLQPGVILQDFLQRIEGEGLFYPPDPTEKGSLIGGNIATSASGARSFRFGTTRDYVLGLRVVLSTGEIVDIERGRIFSGKDRVIELPLVSGKIHKVNTPGYSVPKVKNAAGYYLKDGVDGIDLFIGQEGTLGVITRIKLKLIKKPAALLNCYAFFNKGEEALSLVYRARDLSIRNRNRPLTGIDAVSLEFFDKNSLQLLREKHKNIPEEAKAAVYFEQRTDERTESDILQAWAKLLVECGGSLENTWFAQSQKEKQDLQAVRHDLPDMVNEFIKRKKLTKVGTDIAVTPEHIDEMIRYYNELLTEAGLRYVIFGHLGDNHLHVNILPENKKQHQKATAIYNLFVKKAVSVGGTVSAEHGIGKLKHSYLEMMYGKKTIKEMALFKKSLDPACILGLDNIFPKELLR